MIRLFFMRKFLLKHKPLILKHSKDMRDFLRLLLKQRNTGVKWTNEEIAQLKVHVKQLSLYVPALVIFVLPFGYLMLPVLAELLDRRERRRNR